jgi:uncharacterized protein YecT (DUF1311 family)
MQRKTILFGLSVCLAFITVAHSGSLQKAGNGPAKHPIDAWLEQCTAKDDSTAGQLTCLGEAFGKWDTELNRVYKALTAKLPEAGRVSLRTAQLAWLKFRDEELKLLDAFYNPLDGSMYRLMKAADRVDLIRKRALELASYLDVLSQL